MKYVVFPEFFTLPGLRDKGGIVVGRLAIFKNAPTPVQLRHEEVHQAQMDTFGVLGFYYQYLKDYLQLRADGYSHQAAYYKIPFEVEAYEKENL